MPEEVTNEVRPNDPPVDEAAQTPPVESQATDVQSDGADETTDATRTEDDGPHPLEPGGKRFNQVYARAKDAELKYHAERERAARLEGELQALRQQPTTKPAEPPRYTTAQLQGYIDEGKVTVGQALAYQEETLRLEMERKLEEKVTTKLSQVTQQHTVQQELNTYRQLVPEALQPGTPERTKLETEFQYLVGLGYNANDPKTEILAARAAFGDPQTIKTRKDAATIKTGRDTMQDITTTAKPKSDDKDPLKQLTGEQRKHYQKMIDRGVYKGWAEVKDELLYVPGR